MAVSDRLCRIAITLVAWGCVCFSSVAQVADRYTLVFKDGRRIDVADIEEAGDWLYYYRYDARIGVARAKIKEIITQPPDGDAVPLEEEITGRIFKTHHLRFALSDFLREEYFAAEIEPRLSPAEQRAYVHKLLSLKKMEIFEIDDLRHAAEVNGDVVELAGLERMLIAALTAWGEGQKALRLLAGRHRPAVPEDDGQVPPAAPDESQEDSDRAAVDAGQTATDVGGQDSSIPMTGLGKLQHQREMLLLVIKKHYRVGGNSGDALVLQQAEQDLRIVDLQMRYFNRLPALSPSSSAPPPQSP